MDLICIVEVDWLGFRLDPGPLAGRVVGESTVPGCSSRLTANYLAQMGCDPLSLKKKKAMTCVEEVTSSTYFYVRPIKI